MSEHSREVSSGPPSRLSSSDQVSFGHSGNSDSSSTSKPAGTSSANSTAKKQKLSKRQRVLSGALAGVITLSLAGGGFMVWQGLQPVPPPEEMPLPAAEVSLGDDDLDKMIADLTSNKDTSNDETKDGEPVDPYDTSRMAPSSVWIPSLEAYAPVQGESQFEASSYTNGLQTLKIPYDASQAVWYSDGGAMSGMVGNQSQGTTLIAAHVSNPGKRGAFYDLSKVTGGEIVWTMDAAGKRQSWMITDLWWANHAAFPDEYWKSDGQRQLVITTCGGTMNQYGYYQQNVFAVAVPVDLDGSAAKEQAQLDKQREAEDKKKQDTQKPGQEIDTDSDSGLIQIAGGGA